MEQSLQKEKYFSINGRKGTKRICRKEKLINKGINKENISELKGDSQKPDNLSEDVDGMSKDNTEQMLSIEIFFKSYTPVEYGYIHKNSLPDFYNRYIKKSIRRNFKR